MAKNANLSVKCYNLHPTFVAISQQRSGIKRWFLYRPVARLIERGVHMKNVDQCTYDIQPHVF